MAMTWDQICDKLATSKRVRYLVRQPSCGSTFEHGLTLPSNTSLFAFVFWWNGTMAHCVLCATCGAYAVTLLPFKGTKFKPQTFPLYREETAQEWFTETNLIKIMIKLEGGKK